MKSICYDLRRAIAGRWFFAALIATTVALYLSVGQATYGLIGYLESYELFEENSFGYFMTDMLTMGMKGDFGLLTLPALSALPFAAQALSHPSGSVSDGKKELDHRQGRGMRHQRNAAARCGGGAAVSDTEWAHGCYDQAGLPLGRRRGFLAYTPTPYAVRRHLGGCGLRDRAGDGNGLRSISGPAVPVLCPHDDRHPLFPGRYDAEPDAVGEWRNVVFDYCVGFHSCSASSFPETRCAKICLKGWFSVGARGRHF